MTWQNHFGSKSFEAFNQAFFSKVLDRGTWRFFTRLIVIQVDEQRHFEIELRDGRESSGTYTYYLCKLVNKKTGPITVHEFEFNELTGPKNDNGFKLIDHCGHDWYMNGPDRKSVDALADKIRIWMEVVQ